MSSFEWQRGYSAAREETTAALQEKEAEVERLTSEVERDNQAIDAYRKERDWLEDKLTATEQQLDRAVEGLRSIVNVGDRAAVMTAEETLQAINRDKG